MNTPTSTKRARIKQTSLTLPDGDEIELFDVLLEEAPDMWHRSLEGDRTFGTRAKAETWIAQQGFEEV